jgi:8-oxo-dGTP pyrophosphatase MutT (NUDIX family)
MAVVLAPDRRQVLLLRRAVLLLWDLPGGGIEPGEGPGEAAVRETREETGYLVALEGPVGRYRHQSVYGRGDQLTHVFRARVTGGAPRGFGWETAGLRWWDVDALPRSLQPLQREMIADALVEGAAPVERRIDFPPWKLYPARAAFVLLRALRGALRRSGDPG